MIQEGGGREKREKGVGVGEGGRGAVSYANHDLPKCELVSSGMHWPFSPVDDDSRLNLKTTTTTHARMRIPQTHRKWSTG